MKTLKTIQTLAKIGKIVSKIIFVFSVIGFCGCFIGIIGLAAGVETFTLGGVSIHSIIEERSGMSMAALYASMAVGALFCAAEAILCKFSEIYFKNELEDGDPFTLRGAKELLRFGILAVAIPLGTSMICSIAIAIASHFYPDINGLSTEGFSSVGIGVMLIVLSLFCRYGAEQKEQKEQNE